jgi:hypothetical protein
MAASPKISVSNIQRLAYLKRKFCWRKKLADGTTQLNAKEHRLNVML